MKKQDVYNEILYRMEDELSVKQYATLKMVVRSVLYHSTSEDALADTKTNLEIYDEYIAAKKFEELSDKTLRSYGFVIRKFLRSLRKSCLEVSREEAYNYLSRYKTEHQCSPRTLNNMRRYLLSFYNYLYQKDMIKRNPFKAISSIKEPKTIRKAFTVTEIEILRDNIDDMRDRAIIEVLYATGIRIHELCNLNKDEIMENNSIVIRGKGNKERVVYFNDVCMYHIKKYLKSRTDHHKALFISKRKQRNKKGHLIYKRVTVGSIEKTLQKYGEAYNIYVHPHKFRRTLISKALDHGMPLQEVQIIAGHSSPNTTMTYADLNQDMIRMDFLRSID